MSRILVYALLKSFYFIKTTALFDKLLYTVKRIASNSVYKHARRRRIIMSYSSWNFYAQTCRTIVAVLKKLIYGMQI